MLCLSGFELYSRWVPPDDHFTIRARLDTAHGLGDSGTFKKRTSFTLAVKE